jgi:hypothetical protein
MLTRPVRTVLHKIFSDALVLRRRITQNVVGTKYAGMAHMPINL